MYGDETPGKPFYKTNLRALIFLTNLISFVLFFILTVIFGEYVGHDVFMAKYNEPMLLGCVVHIIAMFLNGIYLLATTREL